MKVKRLLLAIFLVLFTAILAYIIRDLLARYLFLPILNVLQIIRVIIGALPQIMWWGILILLLFIIVIRNLRWGKKRRIGQKQKRSYTISRAIMWMNMIERAQKSDYSNWLLTNQISDLILELLAYRERVTREQVQNNIVNGTLDLPIYIKTILSAGTEAPSFRHFTDLLKRSKNAGLETHSKTNIHKIVEFLESNF